VINLSVTDARTKLEAADLGLEVADRVFSETVPAGSVISTDPEAGSRVVDGRTVAVVVSKGLERYAVPKLHGRTLAAAEAAVTNVSLTVGDVTKRWSDTVPEGRVIIASPTAGQEERRETPVDLVVSKGPQPVKVPDLTGENADKARTRLTALGLKVRSTEEHSRTVAQGAVISQSPDHGIRHHGDRVSLVVSLGPVMVQVPDLSAMSVQEATNALRGLGLDVEVHQTSLFVGLDRVVGQDVDPGKSVPEGTVVRISVV
jgi:serine/threonine-protein kinase